MSSFDTPFEEGGLKHDPAALAITDDWDDWMRWDDDLPDNPAFANFGSGALQNLDRISLSIDPDMDFTDHATTPSLSTDRQSSAGLPPSPDSPVQPNKRKRKSNADAEEEGFSPGGKPVKKTAHNVIEKKYRNNLNDKIIALRDSVPSLRVKARASRAGSDGQVIDEDLDGLAPAQKLNKGTVLSKATEYIRHLESRIRRTEAENREFKARLELLELGSGSFGQSDLVSTVAPSSLSQQSSHSRAGSMSTVFDSEPQGMIPIPESMQRLRAGLLQRHVEPPKETRRNSTSRVSTSRDGSRRSTRAGAGAKLMVGSLAGLMLLEGMGTSFSQDGNPTSQHQKRSFDTSIPSTRYRDMDLAMALQLAQTTVTPILLHPAFLFVKIAALGIALLYIIIPLFYSPKHKSKRDPTMAVANLAAAPSLASPLEMRRTAWLTSIQIAQVPNRHWYSKMYVLGRMTVELNLRNLLGWQWYNYIMRISEDEELARIKAWDIAVDALLAGGDSEIDKSRLTLAIMASGTLPETRTRFMMKALHIRVLLWRAINAGDGSWSIFENAVAGLGRWQWRKGQELQKPGYKEETSTKTVASHASTTDNLPDYLQALLARDCDEVLVGPIVHRAYNLALNKPTTDEIEDSDDGLNSVVEDFAIRSPLDAIAAWFSCLVLRDSMVTLLERGGKWEGFAKGVELSLSTSPPGSIAQLRALAIKATFTGRARKQSLHQALEILTQSSSKRSGSTPSSLLATTDVLVALRCALALDQKKESLDTAIEALDTVNSLLTHRPTNELHLLGFLASYTTLKTFSLDESLEAEKFESLSSLASYLKSWIRGEPGRRSGLSKELRESVMETCTRIRGSESDSDLLEDDQLSDVDDNAGEEISE